MRAAGVDSPKPVKVRTARQTDEALVETPQSSKGRRADSSVSSPNSWQSKSSNFARLGGDRDTHASSGQTWSGRMSDVYVGVDVSKDKLDVAFRPEGEALSVA